MIVGGTWCLERWCAGQMIVIDAVGNAHVSEVYMFLSQSLSRFSTNRFRWMTIAEEVWGLPTAIRRAHLCS